MLILAIQILTSNYFKLKLRPEVDFERILLEDVGFSSKALLRHSDSGKGEPWFGCACASSLPLTSLPFTGFDRAIEVYLK